MNSPELAASGLTVDDSDRTNIGDEVLDRVHPLF